MKSFTNEQLIEAVANSTSIRQVLFKLNLVQAGGNYLTIKTLIKQLSLDTSHFTRQSWAKNRILGPKRNINEYLSNRHTIHSCKLKERLLNEKLLEYKCYQCLLTIWLQKPIPLELHHIDGNSSNNSLSNLTLLCPNCHSFTPNYRGKNISS